MLANEEVVVFVLYFLMIGALSEFLQMCYKKGMILRPYYVLIMLAYLKSPRKWVRFLMKPLGVCIDCQSFWVNTVLFPFYWGNNPLLFILSIGGVYISLELIYLLKKWTQ